jgi:hypothetical protein
MSERIDILMPIETGMASFVVNNAAAGGVVPLVAPSGSTVLYNSGAGSLFTQGDSFIIQTFGLILPLSFQLDRSLIASKLPRITLYLNGYGFTTNLSYTFQEISVQFTHGSNFYLIMENYDTPLNIFIDIPNEPLVGESAINNEQFQLQMGLENITSYNVSMVGVPAALNGTTQYIIPYLKILHNEPLSVV